MRFAKYSNLSLRHFNKYYKFDYITLFINFLQKKGKKLHAFKIVSKFLLILSKKYNKFLVEKNVNIKEYFLKIFDYYCPKIGFRRKKVAGKVYMLPIYINLIRGRLIFLRWFIQAARKRSEKNLILKLIGEFDDIKKGVGRTVRRLEEYYELATENRPFLYYLRKKKRLGAKVTLLKKFKL